MKIKTSELEDRALSWAAGVAEGHEMSIYGVDPSIRARIPGLGVIAPWRPAYYWSQGGPIIERERFEFSILTNEEGSIMAIGVSSDGNSIVSAEGPTYLIAAMRCFVASRLGDEVEIPEELL